MTAPTSMSLPSAPVAAGPDGGASAGSAENAPAFASVLDDALTDGGSGQQAAGGAPGTTSATASADDTAITADPADDQPTDVAPDAATLPGGTWVMLMAALGLGGTPPTPPPAEPSAQSTSPTQPALSGLGSVSALPAGMDVPAIADPPAPFGPPAPAGLPASAGTTVPAVALPPAPAAVPPVPGTVGALAGATGLTVLTAPTTTVSPSPGSTVGAPSTDNAPGVAGEMPLLLPVAGSTGDAADTASGGTSGGGTSGGGAGAAALPVTAEADPVPDAVATVGLGAPFPTARAAAAGPATAATAATGQEPPVAAQLAPQLAVLRNAPDGTQTMTLVITPDSLGPVAVQVTVTDGTLDLTLHGASEHGRHALTEALPELRRDLESASLTFSRLEVGADTGRDGAPGDRSAQQQLADLLGNGAQQRQPDTRGRAWAPPGSHLGAGGPVRTSSSSASPGVDVRV